jgi:putative acetyltransferase
MRRKVNVFIEIREERPDDIAAIRDVNNRAFGQAREANIVDALRRNGAALLSLVATMDDRIMGHMIYSPASVGGCIDGAALGPMAVLPEHQRQGIGTKLVEAGNKKLKDAGCPFIIVVGHVEYYPRFGFRPASDRGIKCEWDFPDNVFMLLTLNESKMKDVSGLAKYGMSFQPLLSNRWPCSESRGVAIAGP